MFGKKFWMDLIATEVISFVAVPSVLIGMGIGGYMWSEVVEPKLDKVFKKDKDEES